MQESLIHPQKLDVIEESAYSQRKDQAATNELQKQYGEMRRSERTKNVLNYTANRSSSH